MGAANDEVRFNVYGDLTHGETCTVQCCTCRERTSTHPEYIEAFKDEHRMRHG